MLNLTRNRKASSDRLTLPASAKRGEGMHHVAFAVDDLAAELEALAVGHGIALIDPAIDRINEAALEGCGEPLLEGDDPFELNTYAVRELLDHV